MVRETIFHYIRITLAIAAASIALHVGDTHADFGAALKAYQAGDKRAFVNDLAMVIQSRSLGQLERWWDAMWALETGWPPSIGEIAPADTREFLNLMASGYFQAGRIEELIRLNGLQHRLGLTSDARDVLRFAARLGHSPAIIALSAEAQKGGRSEESLSLVERAATLGEAGAVQDLACAYLGALLSDNPTRKLGLPQLFVDEYAICMSFELKEWSPEKTFRWLLAAAEQEARGNGGNGGDRRSRIALGWMYLRGIGAPVNKARALELFLVDAEVAGAQRQQGRPACLASERLGLAELDAQGASESRDDSEFSRYYKARTVDVARMCAGNDAR